MPRPAWLTGEPFAFDLRGALTQRADPRQEQRSTLSTTWTAAADFTDIRYEKSVEPDSRDADRAPAQGGSAREHPAPCIAKITIDRPEVRNAFRPLTVIELSQAFEMAREDSQVGAIVLCGEGPLTFCSGGDQRVRGDSGYLAEDEAGKAGIGRFHVTDLHIQIRRLPKPVVAMVAGYAFDGGFGAGLLANVVGVKKAKEIWFLCRQYDAQQALEMGLVNTVVPLERLEDETVQWCREMLALSPFSLRLLKASCNASEDGLAGIQQLAHDANLLFYGSEEAKEGREAYKQKRKPDFDQFPRRA